MRLRMPRGHSRGISVGRLRRVSPDHRSGHLLFVPSSQGYRLEERDGPAPERDERVEIDGAAFVVSRVGASPLPLDARPCVYLLSC
jgi:hypothetical protein